MEVQSWTESSHESASPKSDSITSLPRTSSSSGTITSPAMQSISRIYEETSFSSPETINPSISQYPCIATLKTQTPQIISFLALRDGKLYAASLNEITIFDLTNYTLVDNFSCKNPSSGLVKSIAFVERKIFTAHQDCKIRVWKLSSSSKKHQQMMNLISTIPTVKDRFRRCILPKNYVQVRRHKQKLWIEHSDTVSGLAVFEKLIYSISWDKCFKIWRMSDLCCLESVQAHSDAINAIVVSSQGIIYTASADCSIKIWGKFDGEKKHSLIATLDKHNSSVNALALSNDGSILFSGGCDKKIFVWRREESDKYYMRLSSSLDGHKGAVLCLIYVDDLVISGSSDKTVRIWKHSKECGYCCMAVLEGHSKPIKSLEAISRVNSNGGVIISIFSGSLDGEIKVWEISASDFMSRASIGKGKNEY